MRKQTVPVAICVGLFLSTAGGAEATPEEQTVGLSRAMHLTNDFLNIPVHSGATMRHMIIEVDGKVVREFDIELAEGNPDWWAFVDVSPFQGQTAQIHVDALPPGSPGLSSLIQSNGIVGSADLYREPLRPQVHFSSRRGWINDPNGMVYHAGRYHLYFQHNPYGWGSAQKHWGHAISPDMVHWQELPEAIYPHAYRDEVWSGSAVIDRANTGGFKTGTNDVIVVAFTSTGRGECIAFSNDGGLTFTDHKDNPVVVHSGRDPHLLWYAPSNSWVMALYDSTDGDGITFHSSPDLRQWTFHSKIDGFFECPDLFEMPVEGEANVTKWVLYSANSDYRIGDFDGATFTPETDKLRGNHGRGFYAAQTFTVMPPGDSRRVRMGWAQLDMPGMAFNQMMFFPTELTLRRLPEGLRLCAEPIAEITNAVASSRSWRNLELNPGDNPLSELRGECFDVRTEFVPGPASEIAFDLCGIRVSYSPSNRQLTCSGITQLLPPMNGSVKLQMITDRQSVEVFGNDGQLYMPIALKGHTPVRDHVALVSEGAPTLVKSLTVNRLHSIWLPNQGDVPVNR